MSTGLPQRLLLNQSAFLIQNEMKMLTAIIIIIYYYYYYFFIALGSIDPEG